LGYLSKVIAFGKETFICTLSAFPKGCCQVENLFHEGLLVCRQFTFEDGAGEHFANALEFFTPGLASLARTE